jgi:hypothetical protein
MPALIGRPEAPTAARECEHVRMHTNFPSEYHNTGPLRFKSPNSHIQITYCNSYLFTQTQRSIDACTGISQWSTCSSLYYAVALQPSNRCLLVSDAYRNRSTWDGSAQSFLVLTILSAAGREVLVDGIRYKIRRHPATPRYALNPMLLMPLC